MSATNRKLRVVHFCNQLGIGGTERTMELFCKYLDRSRFEVFAVSSLFRPEPLKKLKVDLASFFGSIAAKGKKRMWAHMNARIPNFQKILGADHVLLVRSPEELRNRILEISPDILHVHYSGRAEPPTSDEALLSKVPLTVTTNQFELENTAPAHKFVKRMFFVSNWMLQNRAQWATKDPRTEVFYNLTEKPCSNDDLRSELGIPKNAFVIGRVGRADPGIHDPISLKAYQAMADEKTYFVALSPPQNMLEEAKAMGLKNFIALPPTADEVFLSKFYNTIDVLAHARRDGETFGCNLAEAMIHSKPVISHLTPFMNAQKEVIGDGGHVCAQDDWKDYAENLRRLRDDLSYRKEISQRAKRRALEQFEAKALTSRLENTYMKLLNP